MTANAMLESTAWRVTFVRQGDRRGHVVELLGGAGAAPLRCESIEGDDGEFWPLSPPLKELSIEARPDGRQVALLVGMAGPSHWSLSIELDPREERLAFDVACRFESEPRLLLGSSYALTPELAASLASPASNGAISPGSLARLELGQAPSVKTACRWDPVGGGLRIEPVDFRQARPASGRRTVRWMYALTRNRAAWE